LTTRIYAALMPNIAAMCGAGDEMEIRLSSSASTARLASEGPTEPDVARGDFVGPTRKPYCSMPNMYITFSATEKTASECIPMQVSAEVVNGSTKPVYVHVF
jgi:hypothetical protein